MNVAETLDKLVRDAVLEKGLVVFLTGAGLSSESGIPTFRGHDGYWTIGSVNYYPMDLATFAQFSKTPGPVWAWYLSRRATYANAKPNSGHLAMVDIEHMLGDRFLLITQNVDGLHRAAGSSPERTYPIHGDIGHMRCSAECTRQVFPLPGLEQLPGTGADLTAEERSYLTCPRCGGWFRPHVLWFDEMYNEEWYHLYSAYSAASRAAMLVVVGTSGATNLPAQLGRLAVEKRIPIIDINPEAGYFAELVEQTPMGVHLSAPAGETLPLLVQSFRRALGPE